MATPRLLLPGWSKYLPCLQAKLAIKNGHQPVAAVLLGKSLNEPILVFEHSSAQVVRHPDVDHARLAGDNVYAIAMISHG